MVSLNDEKKIKKTTLKISHLNFHHIVHVKVKEKV